jgi:hypothetical protein
MLSGIFGTSDKGGSLKSEPMRESDPALGFRLVTEHHGAEANLADLHPGSAQ